MSQGFFSKSYIGHELLRWFKRLPWLKKIHRRLRENPSKSTVYYSSNMFLVFLLFSLSSKI